MIIKKPYAFLIKNFRIIHLLLSVALIFVAYKTSAIYNFFNAYVTEGYYTNLGVDLIDYYIFLIIILIILVSVILYFLLKWKDKKTFYYTLLCIFYLGLFIVCIYMFNVFQNIQVNAIDTRLVRITRDISLIATIPQYLFIAFTIFRSIGFDIKKFNFNKDLADLDINVKDNEEVELILAKDTYKYLRGIRRAIREVKYFAIENRFFFFVIVFIIILGISLSVYLNINVYNKTYIETENFIADGLNISVDSSYISSLDYSGKIINKNKSYVIVKLNIQNNSSEDIKINTDNYRLLISNNIYYPNLSKANYFLDIGNSYLKETFISGEKYEVLFIYEINTENIDKDFVFRIVNNVKLLEGSIEADYKDVNLKPKKLNEIVDINENIIGDEINFKNSNLENSTFKVNSILIKDSFTEKYNYCVTESKCYEGNKIISTSVEGKNKNTLVRLDTKTSIDENISISKYLNSGVDYIKYFASFNYTINNVNKNASFNIIYSDFVKDNIIFIELPKEIKNASNIKLYLTIRNIRYTVNLK